MTTTARHPSNAGAKPEVPAQLPGPDGLPLTVPPDPGCWHFSFGHGQRLRAFTANGHDGGGTGASLDNAYVTIPGTFLEARERMYALFGPVWCDQYDQLPAVPGIQWRDLTAILLPWAPA